MSIYIGTAVLVLILAIAGRMLWRNGHYHGLTAGMLIGYRHGERDGYGAGYSKAALDHVRAVPTEAQHYAGLVSQLPGAYDSAGFAEALLNGKLREPVGEEAS